MSQTSSVWSLIFVAVASAILDVSAAASEYQGFGASTKGGDEGRVVAVTTLADSGPGSLRQALAGGDRRIVFKVGGVIPLKDSLVLTQSRVTLDGRDAPAPGITIVNMPFVIQDAQDVIVRHVRFRESADDNVRITGNSRNIVVDHCSSTRAADGAIDITLDYKTKKRPRDITVSWCLIAGTEKAMLVDSVDNLSLHHNLLTNNDQRSPQLHNVQQFDMRNNAVWFWLSYGARARANSSGNIVNNIFGPSSNPKKRADAALFVADEPGASQPTIVYINGNIASGMFEPNRIGTASRALQTPAIDMLPASDVLAAVLKDVGAQPTDKIDGQYLKLERDMPFRPAKK